MCAFDGPVSFTLNVAAPSNVVLPSWIGQPVVPKSTFATLDVPIQPPDTTSFLLVTVYFQEKEGGFLRIFWQGAQNAQLLSDNFYEGIGMANQRSLLISPDALQGPGTLTLQCGDSTLGVQRIRFQWLENQNSLVSSEIEDTLVTPAIGSTEPAQVLDGQPQTAEPPAWNGRLVIVPITDVPERIEQGVDFGVQLDDVPLAGRLVLKENGLPWGKHLVVWINRKRAATITPAVPDLRDDGFPADDSTYVGWREGSVFLPPSVFKAGPDTVQFSTEDDNSPPGSDPGASSSPPPLAVKDVVLQLNYPEVSATVIPPAPPTPPADLSIPGASGAARPAPESP